VRGHVGCTKFNGTRLQIVAGPVDWLIRNLQTFYGHVRCIRVGIWLGLGKQRQHLACLYSELFQASQLMPQKAVPCTQRLDSDDYSTHPVHILQYP
jgi:hypothetical protein